MNWLTLESIAEQLWARMTDASLRAIVLAALAGLLILFLRKRSAAQHAVWTLVTLGMVALPLLRPIIPAARLPISRPRALEAIRTMREPELAVNPVSTTATAPAAVAADRTNTPAFRPSWIFYAALMYIAGVLLFAARLLLGLFLTRRLLRGAQSIAPDLGRFDVANGAMTKIRIEESERVRVPVTLGLKAMRIILPADWREWPNEKVCVVLAHELAHVQRRDPLVALLAAINRCIFWFHPLAWWLERHLAMLAEHAADDTAMKVARDAESYARTVLEVASSMQGQSRRLIWSTPGMGGTAMSGPVVARRIRRVIDPRVSDCAKRLGKAAWVCLFVSAVLVLWVAVAVDFQNVAHAQQEGQTSLIMGERPGFSGGKLWPGDPGTAEQAAEMKHQLAANPEDETTREKLIYYYFRDALKHRWLDSSEDQRLPLILWLIDHHPESTLHRYEYTAIRPDGGIPNPKPGLPSLAFEEARRHWLVQVQQHPQDAQVLWNAGRAISTKNHREGIELLSRAQMLEPARMTLPLADLYSEVLVGSAGTGKWFVKDDSLAAHIRSELKSSKDIGLVGTATCDFVANAAYMYKPDDNYDFAALKTIATELVNETQRLDPQGQRSSELMNGSGLKCHWSDLMEKVRGLPDENVPQEVAAGNLVQSPKPAYPLGWPKNYRAIGGVPLVVTLRVRIGNDGHVTEVGMISGDPMVEQEAMDAVKHYVYKPFLLDGNAVEVETTVQVPFGTGAVKDLPNSAVKLPAAHATPN